MNRLSINVPNIVQVLQYYDKIKVYKSATETGTYTEVSVALTRPSLIPEQTVYFFNDDIGTSTDWYKTSYFNSGNSNESTQSSAIKGGVQAEKVGWTFNNYGVPAGEWGDALTPDDMRYTYLWGVDLTASDPSASSFTDEQIRYSVEEALSEFERELTIVIRKRVYKCQPAASLIRSAMWRTGVDYTHIDDTYPFDPMYWANYGFLQLRNVPVLSVESLILYNQIGGQTLDLLGNNWVRLHKEVGQIHMYPTGQLYGPFVSGVLPWRTFNGRFPDGFKVDYTAGFETAEFIPRDLRGVIAKLAALKILAQTSDGIMMGIASQSVSLDGLSESTSLTQSGNSLFFGAKINQYTKDITDWLTRNRNKFGAVPLSFVGV